MFFYKIIFNMHNKLEQKSTKTEDDQILCVNKKISEIDIQIREVIEKKICNTE